MAIASWIPCCNHIGNSCKDFKLTKLVVDTRI
jgi:hypothetical protein